MQTPNDHKAGMAGLPAEQQQSGHINKPIELSKLRKSHQLKQSELAELMGVSQANISKLESGQDILLSTLQKYVTALGGQVSIVAKMPDGEVTLI